jgi:hypothetical protein
MSAVRVRFAMLIIAACGCSGCSQRPPWPEPPANAAVDSYVAIYRDFAPPEGFDAVIVARCRSSEQFGLTRSGNWNHYWYVVTSDVTGVEQGTWPEPTLSFICFDAWPTLESGIMISKAIWPYRPDVRMRFWLDARRSPARIVGQQVLFDPGTAGTSRPAD